MTLQEEVFAAAAFVWSVVASGKGSRYPKRVGEDLGQERMCSMQARVTTFQVSPDHADEVVGYFGGDTTTDALQGRPGFKQALMLIDRSSGQGMTVTVWETERDLEASAEVARTIFEGIADRIQGTPSRMTYDVGALLEPR
jgi:hypothetical protein